MTEASSLGSMTTAPEPHAKPDNAGSWALWQQIAANASQFGKPDVFANDPTKTLWESFTVTLRKSDFFAYMEQFTGNVAGAGGLVTFNHSGWMLSIVLAHQPHFADQPEDCWVFWGYGLHPWNPGNLVNKPMLECSGEEILRELAHHLQFSTDTASEMFADANCIPCQMPYITSQFMPRRPGDRPEVAPERAENFAFVGQFCEVPEDTVFTVEYSVRTAQQAVGALAGDVQHTPLYRGFVHPLVLARATKAILKDGK